MKPVAIVFFLLVLGSTSLFAQKLTLEERKEIVRRQFLGSFREKTGTTPDKLSEARVFRDKAADIKGEAPAPQAWEMVVSKVTSAESELHAIINPADTNNIVVGAMGYTSTGTLAFPIYYTKEFGKSWKKATFTDQPVSGSLRLGGGDPMFCYDLNGSLLYVTWIDLTIRNGSFDSIYANIYFATSTNGGQNWKSSRTQTFVSSVLTNDGGIQGGLFPDKQWLACDRSNSANRGTIYGTFLFFSDIDIRLNVTKKSPTDTAFSEPIKVDLGGIVAMQIATIDIDDRGHLHITFHGSEDNDVFNIYHVVSTDGGNTFSQPKIISRAELAGTSGSSADYVIPGFADRQVPSIQVACGKGEGRNTELYCVWDGLGISENLGNGSDVYFSRSTNRGDSWSEPIIVNGDPRGFEVHQYRSTMTVNDRGIISIGWYDGRTNEENTVVDYYTAFSFDGGKTFVAEQAVTTAQMDFTTVGLRNGEFGVGEYMQIVSTPHTAIPIWSDGRKGSGDLDIYAALVPIAGQVLGVKSISNVEAGISLESVQPNPASDHLKLTISLSKAEELSVSIIDMLGASRLAPKKYELPSGLSTFELSCADLPSGSYILRITTQEGSVSRVVTVVK
ncbi:MAG TPA: T9SS type A sorting domain-containing protein [Candidatus Kapabacteria bacterium]